MYIIFTCSTDGYIQSSKLSKAKHCAISIKLARWYYILGLFITLTEAFGMMFRDKNTHMAPMYD